MRKFLPWTKFSIILVGIIHPISFIHARTYSPRRMEAARTFAEQLGLKAKMKWTKYIPVGLTWQRSLIKSDSIIACGIFSLFLITSYRRHWLSLPLPAITRSRLGVQYGTFLVDVTSLIQQFVSSSQQQLSTYGNIILHHYIVYALAEQDIFLVDGCSSLISIFYFFHSIHLEYYPPTLKNLLLWLRRTTDIQEISSTIYR